MTRMMRENEKKMARAEQKIQEETGVLKQKEKEIIELSIKLEEDNKRKDFLIKKVYIISLIYWENTKSF